MNKTLLAGLACTSILWTAVTGCGDESTVLTGGEAGHISLGIDFDPAPVKGPRADLSRSTATEITAESLTLTLTRDDGAIPPQSSSVNEFKADQPTGNYTLEACYGSAEDEGWDMPYYYGKQQLTVKYAVDTPVNLPVQLANSIVNISLSEGFTGFMTDYTVTVTTSAGKDFEWADGETRQLYVKPGSIMISVAFTKPNGKTGTAQIEPFTAEARHRYNVAIDVEAGSAETLSLTFDDTFEQNEVDIDISDANLPMLAAAPMILTDGFEPGTTISTVSGCPYDSKLKSTIVARGKIASAVLNINSAYLASKGCPSTVDLAAAESQSLLATYGITTLGLTGNKDVFAVADFTNLVSHILYVEGADNTSTFSLTVTDAQGKETTTELFKVEVEKLILEILDGSEITSAGNATVKVRYNGASAQNDIKVYARNTRGTQDLLTICTVTADSQQEGVYDLVLTSSDITLDASLTIYAIAGDEQSDDYTLRVPSLRLIETETNAFATHAYATVRFTTQEAIDAKENVKFEVSTDGGSTYSEVASSVESTASAARALQGSTVIYHLTGLTPGKSYTFRAALADENTAAATIATEQTAQLPNSGMEDWTSEQRGDYQTWWFPATSKTASWGTMNAKTTSTYGSGSSIFSYGGTAYRATSGTIPANANIAKSPSATANSGNQHSGNNAALIRTVGWGSGNTSFGYSGKCENVTAGELFLGSTDNSFNAIRGMSFTSRPSSISFYCKYTPYKEGNGDYGLAEIKLKDKDGNIIGEASKRIESLSDYTLVTLEISYAPTAAKAASIEVNFYSSGNSECLKFDKDYLSDAGSAKYTNQEYTGSKLYIDDIVLNY